MTPSEYERARTSGKFKSVDVDQVIPYPDGTAGFYFARLAYVDNVEAAFAADREARRQPVESQAQIAGESIRVRHSVLDAGQISHTFDGDSFTLARGQEANPFVLELIFPRPRPVTGLMLTVGSMDFSVTAQVHAGDQDEPATYTETFRGLPPDPRVELSFDRGPAQATQIRLEIQNLQAGETANIHIREVVVR
jgi:hypothetical protein